MHAQPQRRQYKRAALVRASLLLLQRDLHACLPIYDGFPVYDGHSIPGWEACLEVRADRCSVHQECEAGSTAEAKDGARPQQEGPQVQRALAVGGHIVQVGAHHVSHSIQEQLYGWGWHLQPICTCSVCASSSARVVGVCGRACNNFATLWRSLHHNVGQAAFAETSSTYDGPSTMPSNTVLKAAVSIVY